MTIEKTIRANGVELATEAFGNPADRPLLLIMGAMASMLWWSEDFVSRLAAQGRFVIRYDNRDTGLSTGYEPGTATYSFDDMADDAGHVLDAYGIARADVVGMSMGGMIAQTFALRHPDRVASLTAISTSPVGIDTAHLPGTTAEYMEHAMSGESLDWTDRTEVVDFMLRNSRAIAGSAFPFDEARARALIERDYDRARRFVSATNHFSIAGGSDLSGRLATLAVPVLVLHGTADPIFPVEHGAALAQAVADGRLVELEGGGHELHPGHWDVIVAEIARHGGRGA